MERITWFPVTFPYADLRSPELRASGIDSGPPSPKSSFLLASPVPS